MTTITIPDNWLPTSENINALPRPVRDYIMRLHANTDPAGELQRAMIAEMERDALRKMMEWQPIETAPRDREILLYVRRPETHRYFPDYICVGLFKEARPDEFREAYWSLSDAGPGAYDSSVDGQPSHWMPLPEVPDAV